MITFLTIFGLPAHPFVVHAVVVLVPLSALAGLVVAVWPAAREGTRRWLSASRPSH
jgi:hypothetical protein